MFFFFSLFKLIQITIVHFVRLFCLCLCLFCFFSFLCSFRRLRFLARGTRSGAARGHGSSLRHHFAFEVNGQIVKQNKTKTKNQTLSRLKIAAPILITNRKKKRKTHSDLFIKQQQIGTSLPAQFVDPVIVVFFLLSRRDLLVHSFVTQNKQKQKKMCKQIREEEEDPHLVIFAVLLASVSASCCTHTPYHRHYFPVSPFT